MTTNAKNRRLPRSLRKRLEANLSKLTAYEAGRLLMIYLSEWSKSLIHLASAKSGANKTAKDYAPIKELIESFQKRVDDSRGKPNHADEVKTYKGFLLLYNILQEANTITETYLFRLLYLTESLYGELRLHLFEDWVGEIAHSVREWLLYEFPTPVTRDEYDHLTKWAETEALQDLNEIAIDAAVKWAEQEQKRRGFNDLYIGRDFGEAYRFWEAHRDRFPDAEGFYQVKASEDFRRVYLEVEGRDRVLHAVFKGDEALLDDWLKNGLTVGVFTSEINAKQDETYNRLAEMVEKGELDGGLAVTLPPDYEPVLIRDGTIPASVALRVLWRDWLWDRGIFERPHPQINPASFKTNVVFYGPKGNLDKEALITQVGEFVEECRAKPWGKGIAQEIDFDALASYLSEAYHPLIVADAPDVGRVNYEEFRAYQGDEDPHWEASYYATAASLNAKKDELKNAFAIESESYGMTWLIQRQYYLAQSDDQAREKRSELAHLIRMIDALQLGKRSRIRLAKRGNRIPLDAFFGAEVVTPIQSAIKELGNVSGEIETLKRAIQIVSDEYFGGLPILFATNSLKLETVESRLSLAEDFLDRWIQRIEKAEEDCVDLSSLTLTKQQADEASAREMVDSIVKLAHVLAGLHQDNNYDLGRDKADKKRETATK